MTAAGLPKEKDPRQGRRPGIIAAGQNLSDAEIANLIFEPDSPPPTR